MYLTQYFATEEMACHDGTLYPLDTIDDADPRRRTWLVTRLMPLFGTLEVIRAAAGGERIVIDSGYRTLAYDQRLYDRSLHNGDVAPATSSQHPRGRAADIRHASAPPRELHALILSLWDADRLPYLGGLGLYPTFVHVDTRPRRRNDPDHLAQWEGGRTSNRIA